jgi:hypothetical protein
MRARPGRVAAKVERLLAGEALAASVCMGFSF